MKINEFVPDTQIFQAIGKTAADASTTSGASSQDTAGSFYDILKSNLDNVNDMQVQADNTTNAFVSGSETDVSKVMLDTEQAKMSLELAVQIRNKLVDAYQEFNKMQL
jgi:flagellar hook-basal body complex protein FliE